MTDFTIILQKNRIDSQFKSGHVIDVVMLIWSQVFKHSSARCGIFGISKGFPQELGALWNSDASRVQIGCTQVQVPIDCRVVGTC